MCVVHPKMLNLVHVTRMVFVKPTAQSRDGRPPPLYPVLTGVLAPMSHGLQRPGGHTYASSSVTMKQK